MNKLFSELTFQDLRMLAALKGQSSLRSVARAVSIEPAALSKRLVRIEELFGSEIVKRSARGFIFTGEGEKIVEKATEVLGFADETFGAAVADHQFDRVLSIGGRGFLNLLFAEPFLFSAQNFKQRTRLRFLDLSPAEMHRAALSGALDLAVHFEEIEWTSSWTTVKAGEMSWRLFAAKNHRLGSTATLAEALKFPFIGPGYWTGEKLSTGEDGFPVPWRLRTKGYEVQTAMNALLIVRSTNQLVFLPTAFAEGFLKDIEVKTVQITDAEEVKKPVYFSAKTERLSQRELLSFVEAAKSLISKDTSGRDRNEVGV